MNRWIALAAAAALLAGCAGGPARSPAPAGQPAASAASEPSGSPDPAAGNAEPDTPVTSEPDPVAPAPDHEGEPAELTFQVHSVPAPALADLPADLQAEINAISAWEAAERAALWRHGVTLAVPLTVAPTLSDQLAPARPTGVDRAWVRLVGADGDAGAFYFHVQVTRRDAAGRLEVAGEDVVAVSLLEGGAPLVTGYAHAAPAEADGRAGGTVAVWAGAGPESYTAPEMLQLPAPVVTDAAGSHLVPVAALEAVWEVAWLPDGSAALVLGEGVRTAALPVTDIGGQPYVQVADLVAAVDGARTASAEASYAYAVEWRPDLGQLCLWRDARHPIS
ncbi:hypothetical protein J2Z79_000422 [Symbiobacterium terraclitae]|uniref:Lipoprotein n=1 Tax=Symbiobacterium terraclitae TaxID=557451 RepID=A0ABS4JNC9_9FIRM|nr:hypothetical protein [Symbiobacterium terraclitae]MBP2017048.1 hypothetical protein [Symbiobacterium terraclitae]